MKKKRLFSFLFPAAPAIVVKRESMIPVLEPFLKVLCTRLPLPLSLLLQNSRVK